MQQFLLCGYLTSLWGCYSPIRTFFLLSGLLNSLLKKKIYCADDLEMDILLTYSDICPAKWTFDFPTDI